MPHQVPSPCVPFQEEPAARNVLEIIAVVLRNTKFNIQIFCVVFLLSLCVCSVWIPEHTATFALYNINSLVFVNEVQSVYCAVRNEYL